MEIEAIERKSLVQKVVDNILVNIKDGTLKPGDKLDPQRKLAKKLNVGIGCVREALQSLMVTKIIEIKPGKGCFISDLSFRKLYNPTDAEFVIDEDDLYELLEIRIILETQATKIVSKRATSEELAKIEEILKETNIIVEQRDMDLFIVKNLEFHKKIIEYTHNMILQNIYNNTVQKLLKKIELAIKRESNMEYAHMGHKSIYESLKSRDSEGAVLAMENHLKEAAEIARGLNS